MATIWGRLEGGGRGRQWAGGLEPASKHVGRGPSSRLPTPLPPASPPPPPPRARYPFTRVPHPNHLVIIAVGNSYEHRPSSKLWNVRTYSAGKHWEAKVRHSPTFLGDSGGSKLVTGQGFFYACTVNRTHSRKRSRWIIAYSEHIPPVISALRPLTTLA